MELNPTPQRVLYADILRIISAIIVVLIHIGASGWYNKPSLEWNWQIMNMWHDIFRWPVQIFIMVSGMFCLRNTGTESPFASEIKKTFQRILRLLIALIFWGILYNVLYPVISQHQLKELFTHPFSILRSHDLVRIPNKIVTGYAWDHLWFVYMLIGLYLLTPVLKILVNHGKKQHFEYFLVVSFIIGMCIPFYNALNYLIPILPDTIHLKVPELSGYMSYYIAGYYFANFSIKKRTEICFYILGIISIPFTIMGTSYISILGGEPNGILLDVFMPNTLFQSYAVFLLIKRIFEHKQISGFLYRFIVHLSPHTFGIYLIHILILALVNDTIGFRWNSFNPLFSCPIICLLVFGLSYLVSIIIGKIPLLKKYVI